MKLHDFLVKHAMFPFPFPDEAGSAGSTDISAIEVGLLEKEWKALHAVRDDTLVQELCHTLQGILGVKTLPAAARNHLLTVFSPKLEVDAFTKMRYADWSKNPNEAHVSFPNDFFTAEQFELALTLGAESVVVRQGILPRCMQMFGGLWWI